MRSEWTTGRSAYLDVPKPSSPSTIGKTGPRPMNVHLGTGGPSPVKRANIPRAELPQGKPRRGHGLARTLESGRRKSYPPTRTGQTRTTWLSVQCRSCTTSWEQEPGGKLQECGYPRGQLSGRPGADTTFLELPESKHKANRYGMETTTLRRLLPVDAHSARPYAWNNDSEGCRTQATRHLSAVLLSGRPGPWRCPLGSVTDLSSIAQ